MNKFTWIKTTPERLKIVSKICKLNPFRKAKRGLTIAKRKENK